jgi:hypothetical protein
MSTSRIYFLYPSLYKTAGAVELGPIRTSVRHRPARTATAKLYTTTSRRRADIGSQRYGTAKSPPAHLLGDNPRAGRSAHKERPAKLQEEATIDKEIPTTTNASAESESKTSEDVADKPPKQEDTKAEDPLSTVATSADDPPPPEMKAPDASPKDTVLAMPAPSQEAEEDKPPHLQAPPYVHHFDTWTLVKSLQTGGFTQDQSTTIMKAVRTILADNMDLARRGLVSKSNVENETYLFRAACSELKTEVQNNRKSEADKEKTQRAQLQHEVDIMNQRTTQESANLKDELKGMFDDRKMAVRMEQRSMERKVHHPVSSLLSLPDHLLTFFFATDSRTQLQNNSRSQLRRAHRSRRRKMGPHTSRISSSRCRRHHDRCHAQLFSIYDCYTGKRAKEVRGGHEGAVEFWSYG